MAGSCEHGNEFVGYIKSVNLVTRHGTINFS